MERQYGVGINNRYALFFDQDDAEGEVMLMKVASETKKAKEVQLKVNGKTTSQKKEVKTSSTVPTSTGPAIKKADGGKSTQSDGKENHKRVLDARKPQEGPRQPQNLDQRNNRRNRIIEEEPSAETMHQGFDFEGQAEKTGGKSRRVGLTGFRGGHGRKGSEGRHGGLAIGRGGKRFFDRKSGDDKTGIKAIDKREGGGSHNWGTHEDEMKAVEDNANISTDELAAGDVSASGDKSQNELVDETKVMTLAEYKMHLAAERSGPRFNLRKAGEGTEIDPKWKRSYAYRKERQAHEEEDEEDYGLYPQRVNRQKHLKDIVINFAMAPRGRGKGDRGGPHRPGGPQSSPQKHFDIDRFMPDIYNSTSFPYLE